MAEANVLHNTVNKSIDVLLQIQDIKSAKMKQRLTRKKKLKKRHALIYAGTYLLAFNMGSPKFAVGFCTILPHRCCTLWFLLMKILQTESPK